MVVAIVMVTSKRTKQQPQPTVNNMTHEHLNESGSTRMYDITPITSNDELRAFIGKRVMYKPELLTPEFVRSRGTIIIYTVFEIRETQFVYDGSEQLRGYGENDSFGRPINPQHVYIID